jgi:hypothetical protein
VTKATGASLKESENVQTESEYSSRAPEAALG